MLNMRTQPQQFQPNRQLPPRFPPPNTKIIHHNQQPGSQMNGILSPPRNQQFERSPHHSRVSGSPSKTIDLNLNINVNEDGTVNANTGQQNPMMMRPPMGSPSPMQYGRLPPHNAYPQQMPMQPMPYNPYGQPIFFQPPAQQGRRKVARPNSSQVNYDTSIEEERVYCVICQDEYKSSEKDEHLRKHQAEKQSRNNSNKIRKLLIDLKDDKEPKARPIVEPEEFNIQYNPNRFVIEQETLYNTPSYERPRFVDEGVGTDEAPGRNVSYVPEKNIVSNVESSRPIESIREDPEEYRESLPSSKKIDSKSNIHSSVNNVSIPETSLERQIENERQIEREREMRIERERIALSYDDENMQGLRDREYRANHQMVRKPKGELYPADRNTLTTNNEMNPGSRNTAMKESDLQINESNYEYGYNPNRGTMNERFDRDTFVSDEQTEPNAVSRDYLFNRETIKSEMDDSALRGSYSNRQTTSEYRNTNIRKSEQPRMVSIQEEDELAKNQRVSIENQSQRVNESYVPNSYESHNRPPSSQHLNNSARVESSAQSNDPQIKMTSSYQRPEQHESYRETVNVEGDLHHGDSSNQNRNSYERQYPGDTSEKFKESVEVDRDSNHGSSYNQNRNTYERQYPGDTSQKYKESVEVDRDSNHGESYNNNNRNSYQRQYQGDNSQIYKENVDVDRDSNHGDSYHQNKTTYQRQYPGDSSQLYKESVEVDRDSNHGDSCNNNRNSYQRQYPGDSSQLYKESVEVDRDSNHGDSYNQNRNSYQRQYPGDSSQLYKESVEVDRDSNHGDSYNQNRNSYQRQYPGDTSQIYKENVDVDRDSNHGDSYNQNRNTYQRQYPGDNSQVHKESVEVDRDSNHGSSYNKNRSTYQRQYEGDHSQPPVSQRVSMQGDQENYRESENNQYRSHQYQRKYEGDKSVVAPVPEMQKSEREKVDLDNDSFNEVEGMRRYQGSQYQRKYNSGDYHRQSQSVVVAPNHNDSLRVEEPNRDDFNLYVSGVPTSNAYQSAPHNNESQIHIDHPNPDSNIMSSSNSYLQRNSQHPHQSVENSNYEQQRQSEHQRGSGEASYQNENINYAHQNAESIHYQPTQQSREESYPAESIHHNLPNTDRHSVENSNRQVSQMEDSHSRPPSQQNIDNSYRDSEVHQNQVRDSNTDIRQSGEELRGSQSSGRSREQHPVSMQKQRDESQRVHEIEQGNNGFKKVASDSGSESDRNRALNFEREEENFLGSQKLMKSTSKIREMSNRNTRKVEDSRLSKQRTSTNPIEENEPLRKSNSSRNSDRRNEQNNNENRSSGSRKGSQSEIPLDQIVQGEAYRSRKEEGLNILEGNTDPSKPPLPKKKKLPTVSDKSGWQ